MSNALYQQAIKELAKAAHGAGQLAAPDTQALLDNPLCGDRVRVTVQLQHGRIAGLAHETKGCLLCRASASVLGLRATGQTTEDIASLRDALQSMLATGGDVPPDWPELGVFVPARQFSSRHSCVLLPFEALLVALSIL